MQTKHYHHLFSGYETLDQSFQLVISAFLSFSLKLRVSLHCTAEIKRLVTRTARCITHLLRARRGTLLRHPQLLTRLLKVCLWPTNTRRSYEKDSEKYVFIIIIYENGFRKCRRRNVRTKYIAIYIRPILEYAAVVWWRNISWNYREYREQQQDVYQNSEVQVMKKGWRS